ncbi:4884_t:CDS:10, partial [Scutellospora calospora]
MYFSILETPICAKDRHLSPETNASLCSRIMFLWINPLMKKGFKSTLTDNDVFELPDYLKTKNIVKLCKINPNNSILISLFLYSWEKLLVQFIFAMIGTIGFFAPPYFLKKVLYYIQNYSDNSKEPRTIGYLYVLSLFVFTVIPALFFQQASYIGQKLSITFKAIIIDRVNQTTASLNGEIINKKGKITDLVDSDAQKVSALARNFLDLGVLSELLKAIRAVKIYSMENYFHSKIVEARDKELNELNNYMITRMLIRTLFEFLTFMMMLFALFWNTKILGMTLTSSVAFTALILFQNLLHIFNEMPSIIISVTQALVSISRIEEFLKKSELERKHSENNINNSNSNNEIGFRNATIQWPDSEFNDNDSNKFTLISLDCRFHYRKLTLIRGSAGCGKTAMLNALLGGMKYFGGHVFLPKMGRVAYAAQKVWIQNGTIKYNILFGLQYNLQRYSKVLEICCLKSDLAALKLGDETETGENGIALSHGQRQRIALARAIYSQHEVLIVDDFLSAVDLHIAKYIYEQCLSSKLMKNRTRIFVTHHKDLCHGAAMIVCMKDGQIKEKIENTEDLNDDFSRNETFYTEDSESDLIYVKDTELFNFGNENRLISKEMKAEGMVNIGVYKTYIVTSTKGLIIWILVGIIILVTWYIQTKRDRLIKKWANSHNIDGQTHLLEVLSPLNESFNFILTNTSFEFNITDYYLWIYASIELMNILLKTFKKYCIFLSSLIASKELHNTMLKRILSATIRFYDTTPMGRITNRFSKDMEIIDQILSLNVMSFLYSCMSAAALVISATINIDINIGFKFL